MIGVGQWVNVKVPVGAGFSLEDKLARVVYIHEKNRWFMVEVEGTCGKWRECFHLPSTNAPKVPKEPSLNTLKQFRKK